MTKKIPDPPRPRYQPQPGDDIHKLAAYMGLARQRRTGRKVRLYYIDDPGSDLHGFPVWLD
jgi:hypothetical protein